MSILVLNDVHIGFHRKGGTTPKSREKLREYLHKNIEDLLDKSDADHLVVVGDLFDDFEIESRDWVFAFTELSHWILNGRDLTLIAGNHDHSPKANKVSSFEMLCIALAQVAMEGVGSLKIVSINAASTICGRTNLWAVAHCANQDVFNQRLEEILAQDLVPGAMVFVHANYDNKFAAQTDHSLNVSHEMALRFREKNIKLVFAHEHQSRTVMSGFVYIMGNQWPTSVADCLGNDAKYLHYLEHDRDEGWHLVREETWNKDGLHGYTELDWHNLTESDADFVKVVGEATAGEASDVINAIAKFRSVSHAFVIANSVKIAGIAEVSELPENFQAAVAFDVWDFIKQQLDPDEFRVVEELKEHI